MQTHTIKQPPFPDRHAARTEIDPFAENPKVLIVDDDPNLVTLLQRLFERAGARALGAYGGQHGLHQFQLHQPDLVVLDIMMPDMDGWQVCRSIRQVSDVPILMLTAINATSDVTYGLDSGADDYVTKPFEAAILLARARALLRRASKSASKRQPLAYDDGYLAVDLDQRRVSVRRQPVRLSATEYQLLSYLFRGAGQVFSFEQILRHVWDGACLESPEYVHVYIYRLRKKLEQDPAKPRYLVKEHGVGYRFESQAQATRFS